MSSNSSLDRRISSSPDLHLTSLPQQPGFPPFQVVCEVCMPLMYFLFSTIAVCILVRFLGC